MKKRAITSVFIVLITALAVASKFLPYNIGDYVFDGFVIFIAMVAGFEMSNIMAKLGRPTNKYLTSMYCVFNYIILLSLLSVVQFYFIPLFELGLLFLYFLIVLAVEGVRTKAHNNMKTAFNLSYNTIQACFYPSFLICLMLAINHVDFYAGVKGFSVIFIIMIFAITMLTDTFAYLIGSLIKGPKLAPKISPNKTISGSIGGLLGGVAGAMIVYALVFNIPAWSSMLSMYSLSWWHFLIFGLIASIFGQCGDLLESKLKRMANIKDSGNIFPGHGGMLDRVDAMMMVATIMFITVLCITI